MNTASAYSAKAENYAKYRWSYAPAAVQACFAISGLGREAVLADLGAGTGILTRELCQRAGQVFALEPNKQMRALLARQCAGFPNCTVLGRQAEATGLPDASLDMATAAQALHWFNPDATRAELARILKPGGWLAIFSNRGTDAGLGAALEALYRPHPGMTSPVMPPRQPQDPLDFYFGPAYRTLSFPFSFSQTWEAFLGSQLSASFTPDPGQPGYPAFEAAARQIFERFSQAGLLTVQAETSLSIGRLARREKPDEP